MMKAQGREKTQAQDSAPNFDAPKKNNFYAIKSWGDQESSSDVITVCHNYFPLMCLLCWIRYIYCHL